MVAQSDYDRLSGEFPNLRFGVGLAILLCLLEIVWGLQREIAKGTPGAQSAGGYAAALTMIGALVSTAYVLHCIAAYHHIVNDIDGWEHPISPKQAVRFHFIPIFNLYWDFRWPYEIARFVNLRMQRHRMSGVLAGALLLLGFLIGGFFDVSVGLALILFTFAYVARCLRDALEGLPSLPDSGA